jgi:predicted adenylyl cyclase CyaB
VLSPTSAPDSLRESLSLAYGQLGRVRKRRILFMVGRTRVHIDKVEQLGDFLELEVVLTDGEPSDAGIGEAHRLMESLDVKSHQLIDDAYVDLLSAGRATSASMR